MAEYVRVPSRNVVKLPDTMSFEEGAFIEPMACVVHGMNRLNLQVGDRVILFGAGAMGQQLIQSLKMAGASELVVVDVAQEKLDMAVKWGATKGVLSEELTPEDFPEGFDVVVDATGIPAVIENAFQFMGKTATYLQFGVTAQNETVRLDPFKLYNNDWTILGSMAINYTFLPAFHWVKEKRIEVEHLISKKLTLEEAVDFLKGPRSADLFKVQIKL